MSSPSLGPTRRAVLGGLAAAPLAPTSLASGLARAAAPPRRPNVLLLFADDLGFSDVGCFGGEIPTPRIDALARDGLRLATFYTTGRCCPSRAALLTGRSAHAVGVGHMTRDTGLPGYRGHIRPGVWTVADALRATGYDTYCVGKWHLGHQEGMRPRDHGFDHFFGVLEGGGVYYSVREDRALRLDDTVVASHRKDLPKPWYSTDRFADQALSWMDASLDAGRPFLMYLPWVAPHDPLQAPEEEIAAFRGRWQQGWDQVRQDRLAAAIAQGVLPAGTRGAPRDAEVPAWAELDAETRDLADHVMATYAAVTARMDLNTGRLVDRLAERGALDDTLIIFMSDNGASAEGGRVKASTGWGRWGGPGSQVRLGRAWASACNAPFRAFKKHVHEGGTRSPFVAHWPAGIDPALAGTVSPVVGHLVDLAPTLLEVAGADRSVVRQAEGELPFEGVSLVPALEGKHKPRKRTLCFEHEGHKAIRHGDLKLVTEDKGPWALYDLAADPCETVDLAEGQARTVDKLAARWDGWAARVGVEPWPLPASGAGGEEDED